MLKLKPYIILDKKSRITKAKTIIRAVQTNCTRKILKVLEIGTGSGYMAEEFGKVYDKIYSVDINDERQTSRGFKFMKVENAKLPFEKTFFDLVISNHVIEHMPDQHIHVDEVARVLKPNGILYLATPNKYWLTDPHTKLPFVSWLGHRWANIYAKAVGQGSWDIFPLSHKSLMKKLLNFDVNFISPKIIKYNEKYGFPLPKFAKLVITIAPYSLIWLFGRFGPTYNFICTKRS